MRKKVSRRLKQILSLSLSLSLLMGFSPVELRLGETSVGAFESYAQSGYVYSDEDIVNATINFDSNTLAYIFDNVGIDKIKEVQLGLLENSDDKVVQQLITDNPNAIAKYSEKYSILHITSVDGNGYLGNQNMKDENGYYISLPACKYIYVDTNCELSDFKRDKCSCIIYINRSAHGYYNDLTAFNLLDGDNLSCPVYYEFGTYYKYASSATADYILPNLTLCVEGGVYTGYLTDISVKKLIYDVGSMGTIAVPYNENRTQNLGNHESVEFIGTVKRFADWKFNNEQDDQYTLILDEYGSGKYNVTFNDIVKVLNGDVVFRDSKEIRLEPTFEVRDYVNTSLSVQAPHITMNNIGKRNNIDGEFIHITGSITDANINCDTLKVDSGSLIKFTGNVTDLYYMDNKCVIDAATTIPSGTLIHCHKDSPMQIWCENNKRSYKLLTDEDINGIKPSIEQNQKLFDSSTPKDISLTYDLGKKPAGADNISKVYLADEHLKDTEFIIDNSNNTITINADVLGKLPNGTYQVSALFDNDTYATGFSIAVMNSSVSGGGDSQKPPEALTMINYEFYKDHPDYIVIPIKMNGATAITKLVIGTKEMLESTWELQDGAIILDHNELMNFDAGKYRVKPTFNDKENTTISNIQLIVYDSVSDRGAPFLLHQVIDFTGQTLRLTFDGGFGDIEANDVLALVIDDDIVLPNGDVIPFTSRNVKDIQKAREFVLNEDDSTIMDIVTENESDKEDDEVLPIATPSNATYATPSNATYVEDGEEFGIDLINDIEMVSLSHMRSTKKVDGIDTSLITAMSAIDMATDNVFWVEDRDIIVDGGFVESLNLTPGEHLIGAVFDNTEKTMDVKKVVLRIVEDKEDPSNPGTGDGGTGTDPSNPGGEGDKPTNPDGGNTDSGNDGGNTGSGGNNKPTNPDGSDTGFGGGGDTEEPNKRPSRPGSGGGSLGGSSSDSGSSSVIKPNLGHNTDGSYDTGYKPSIPNTGGSFITDENGNKVYMFPDGMIPAASWVADGKNWYYVEKNGMIRTDWFLDTTGYWYQLCKEPGENYGAVIYGWYFEPADNKWYFLSPIDGHMLVGWQYINHKWYYMTETNNGPTYFGDNITGWFYDPTKAWKPFGSMYCNEVTPDNYKVNESGEWVK